MARLAVSPNSTSRICVWLPPLSPEESMVFEMGLTGLSTGEHPMNQYKDWLNAHNILGSAALENCEPHKVVLVSGLPIVHQAPPTAKGVHFITLEDESGLIDLIVKPDIYKSYSRILRGALPLVVEGSVQRKGKVINVIVSRAAALPDSNGANSFGL